MARVLLISCNVTETPYPVFPLGAAMVAEAARARRHVTKLWDCLAERRPLEEMAKAAAAFAPDVVGLSLRNVDNADSTVPASYTGEYSHVVAALRRELGATPIVLGGAAFSLFPEALLEKTAADYGIVGEGELAFCQLVEQIVDGVWPAMRIWRGHETLAGDGLLTPDREPQLVDFYMKEGGMLNLQTKRGCPHRCAYCSYPSLEGARYRARPAEAVVGEIQTLRDKHGVAYLSITDSVFNDAEGQYLQIAEEMVRRDLRVPWMAFMRPQRFKDSEVELLRRSGLASVEWGADAACDATLEGMLKDFTWAEAHDSVERFARAGIPNAVFLIFGGPQETERTLDEGLANVNRLDDCVVFAFAGVRILPGTAIHRRAVAEGVAGEKDDLLAPRFYFSEAAPPSFISERVVSSFAGRRDRIFGASQDVEQIRVFHRMGYRGPVWDLLLRRGRSHKGNRALATSDNPKARR